MVRAYKHGTRITATQTVQVANFLKDNFVLGEETDIHGNRLGQYKGNLADTTVARKLGVSTAAVLRIRQEMFGHIMTPIVRAKLAKGWEVKKNPQGALDLEVPKLEDHSRIATLERIVNKLELNVKIDDHFMDQIVARIDRIEHNLERLFKELGVTEEFSASNQ